MDRATGDQDRELSSLRVLAHPLRLRMLSLLTGSPMSAAELGRELGVSQALASYHLRQLDAAGVVELAEVRARRGGRERRFAYRPPGPDDRPTHHSRQDEALLVEALSVELRRRGRAADPEATWVGVDAELWVDPDAWAAALHAVRAASTALHARARPPGTPGTVRVSVTAAMFSMGDPEDGRG